MLTKEQVVVLKHWAAALRSGEYKRNEEGVLRTEDTYSALGVLCDLAVKAGIVGEPKELAGCYWYGVDGYAYIPPREVLVWSGLDTFTGDLGPLDVTVKRGNEYNIHESKKSFDTLAGIVEVMVVKTLWLDALKGGKYSKSKERLCTGEGYCCLGVLCEVTMEYGLYELEKRDIKKEDLSGSAANVAGVNYRNPRPGGRWSALILPEELAEAMHLTDKACSFYDEEGYIITFKGYAGLTSMNDCSENFDGVIEAIEKNLPFNNLPNLIGVSG